jgi:hypothetical protein
MIQLKHAYRKQNNIKPCTELYAVFPKYIAVILSFHSQISIFIGTYKMATSTVACNVCSVRHITKSSAVWCSECDEGFCTDCKAYHSLAKATGDHVTITIGEYQKLPRFIVGIKQLCDEHREKLQKLQRSSST